MSESLISNVWRRSPVIEWNRLLHQITSPVSTLIIAVGKGDALTEFVAASPMFDATLSIRASISFLRFAAAFKNDILSDKKEKSRRCHINIHKQDRYKKQQKITKYARIPGSRSLAALLFLKLSPPLKGQLWGYYNRLLYQKQRKYAQITSIVTLKHLLNMIQISRPDI